MVISSREFRQNQRKYFDKADQGEQIIVQRGNDKAYVLTPISDNDRYFNGEMVARIKRSLKQVEQGDYRELSSSKEISDLLGL